MESICKHCKQTFEISTKSKGWMANHSRWCTFNPKRKEYDDFLKQRREIFVTSKEILDKHKNVKYFDDLYLAVKKVDLIIIHTEWDEFKNLNFSKIKNNNKKVIIYDLRNLYDNKSFINKNNISYYSIGRPFNA